MQTNNLFGETNVLYPNFDYGRKKVLKINANTYFRILNRLEEFEKSSLFLKKTISLDKLATYCGTNSKYLSHTINYNKEKDFYNYINTLRINFILNLLLNDLLYRKYKISVLAKKSGFSSPSKFSVIFKNTIGILPSEFIRKLK